MPLVSCIMPTADRRRYVPAAIRRFLAQDYSEKELIVLDDGEDAVVDLIPDHPAIRYRRLDRRQAIGAKRNLACEMAAGEIILHWDDDDWYAPSRMRYQLDALTTSDAVLCGIDRVLFADPVAGRAWEYAYPSGGARWVYGATLGYRKSFWQACPFADVAFGEDTRFVFAAPPGGVCVLTDNRFYLGRVHDANTSRKRTQDPRWRTVPLARVQAQLGRDWQDFAAAPVPTLERTPALLVAGGGIGDILRVTPLIRVLHGLGHEVDVLLSPDTPAAGQLLDGAPEIRRLVATPEALDRRHYAVAVTTAWGGRNAAGIAADRRLRFDKADWLKRGDGALLADIARELGWRDALPAPFARASGRRFDLAPGTIALHPGCKHDWPWKKWHGFADLARLLPHVAIVGTPDDLDNRRTYFRDAFDWPDHVVNFVGRLDLADTAALIGQCAALVSNDSGLMHLGVALGVPTHGIFGITSPARESMPSPHMHIVTKGLACEPACRTEAWGRRDCSHRLACLKTLTAAEVASQIGLSASSPPITAEPLGLSRSPGVRVMEAVRLNYYGYVFDASGYGQAARSYIHALHQAGIAVSVVDLGARPAQVEDPLIASLLGTDADADFQLFHGIPPQWARAAFRLRNVIGMTVWETDTMPSTWRSSLRHAIDVWVPCAFNVEVFARGLAKRPFRLPHARPANSGGSGPLASSLARLRPDDFVFYSVFEWQDRKHPSGMMAAFLAAFPEADDAVLVLKTNPGAAGAAAQALAEARAATGAQGRILLCCEAWSDEELAALHARGDCYFSLHKGEGWGYPLFEAACRGKPIIATAFGGPLDYLDPAKHWLVRASAAPVRQAYVYFHRSMQWVEPDLDHAAEGLRATYAARASSLPDVAERLQAEFGLEQIGLSAKRRVLELLEQTNPAKARRLRRQERDQLVAPVRPIPGDWYDADYFEHGRTSNWSDGYDWPRFKGVFEDTADFLAELFPSAERFLDIGCAKGFLVRSLRERGRLAWGVEHSSWAVAAAETAARPFIQQADLNAARFDEPFDMLLVLSVFETLTEAQLDAFFVRARTMTRGALFAVIPVLADGLPPDIRPDDDDDLSHITLRPRRWWHELFERHGWRRDDAAQQACERHRHVRRMGWPVFVYRPA